MSGNSKDSLDPGIFIRVGERRDPNRLPVFRTSYNFDIGLTAEEIWEPGGLRTLPTAAGTFELVSTSAADTATGTGLRVVVVRGLDIDCEALTEVLVLDGTTPVTTVNAYFRVNDIFAVAVGSSQKNEGRVSLTESGNLQQVIPIGESKSSNANFTIPAGFSLMVLAVNFFNEGNKNMFSEVRATIDGIDFSSSTYAIPEQGIANDTSLPFPIPEKSDFRIESRTLTGTTGPVTVQVIGYLINNRTLGNVEPLL